jgi:hypothetical protein
MPVCWSHRRLYVPRFGGAFSFERQACLFLCVAVMTQRNLLRLSG